MIGHRLTQKEVDRARKRAPRDQDGQLLCWGNLTHGICSAGTACPRSHGNLMGRFEDLDYSVPAKPSQIRRPAEKWRF